MVKKKEFFENERASGYEVFTSQWIPNYDFVIKTLPKIIEATNPKTEKILVAGCGTGNEIISLHRYNPSWKITGADPSP